MKAKARTTPIQTTFEAAQTLAQRAWLTTTALPDDMNGWDTLWFTIADVLGVLSAARGEPTPDLGKELEGLISDPKVYSTVYSAHVEAQTAAYLYGLALGLQLGTAGAR